METLEEPKIRHRTFTFGTSLKWTTGKAGVLSSDGKPSLDIASPPEFKGVEGAWTPEDMFVASVEMCHMLTFLSFAGRKKLSLLSYQSSAVGTLEFVDGDYRFTRIVVAPQITVERTVSEADVHSILRESHRHCLVSNSIASVVEVNPAVIFP